MNAYDDAKMRVEHHLFVTGNFGEIRAIVNTLYEYDEELGELLKEHIYNVSREVI